MRRAYRILPCYTGDVSGVCSALYELGGMVVIHDPSGCNSTYNTHDETRWYDQDSMIFISGLSEMDAILGADEKLVAEITETALDLQPKFIALVSSPVPYMNGTDFPALARLIQNRTGIDCFFVPTNGMHDYVAGAGRAFLELARRYAKKHPAVWIPQSVSILGLTPWILLRRGTAAILKAKLEEWGYSILSCWAMDPAGGTCIGRGCTGEPGDIPNGTGCSKELHRRFHTPYVAGIPLRQGFDALKNCAGTGHQNRGESASLYHSSQRRGEGHTDWGAGDHGFHRRGHWSGAWNECPGALPGGGRQSAAGTGGPDAGARRKNWKRRYRERKS